MKTATQPRAAYVHVPFCRRRCGYCNFTLVAGRDDLINDYLQALQIELKALVHAREVDTIFLGGGTPSHLPPPELSALLELVTTWFHLSEAGEFSVEANPEDCDPERIHVLRSAGVTRISLGAQSFDEGKLKSLERDHDADDVIRATHAARDRGIDVSLDLIFAAPGETLTTWRADLDRAIKLAPDHVSTYGLTFDQGAAFWSRRNKGAIEQAEEETEAQMYEFAIDALPAAGFEHYEVSNFAKPTKRCRHNETYWLGGSYFAVGPGAARFVDGRRETNHRSTTTYIQRVSRGDSPVAEIDEISDDARRRERFAFGLRRIEGVDCQMFTEATDHDPREFLAEPLARHFELGLLEQHGNVIRLTRNGLLISDSILADLL